MGQKLIFAEEFGKAFIPKRFRPKLKGYLLKAGYTEVPFTLYGGFFYLSLIATYLVFILLVFPKIRVLGSGLVLLLSFSSWLGIQLGLLAAIMLAYYLFIEQIIFIRTQRMEDVLEDFLHVVSENLKGGLTLEEAFWSAVKPEFGVLSNEIQLTAKKVMTGEDVTDALRELSQKYDSPMLTRSLNLVIQSIEGGAKISEILDRINRDIKETKRLKKEMATTNLTYVIFVSFVVLVVAPGLFTLSNQLLKILAHFSENIAGGMATGVQNMPINLGDISIDPEVFERFSFYGIGLISVCASMIIALIRKGSIRAGLKLIPIYVTASYIVMIIFSKAAGAIFSTMIGF
jgi:pilus assembly protein TadC